MKKRYLIATLIGTFMGLGLIFLLAYAGGYTWHDTGWDVPYAHNARAEVLQNQALLLRASHILLQDGLVFLAIPILGSLALTRLMPSFKMAIRSTFSRRVIWIYIASCFALFCFGFLQLGSSDLRTAQQVETWDICIVLVLFGWAICALTCLGILPGLALIGALLLEWKDNCKDIPDVLASRDEQRSVMPSIAQELGEVVCTKVEIHHGADQVTLIGVLKQRWAQCRR